MPANYSDIATLRPQMAPGALNGILQIQDRGRYERAADLGSLTQRQEYNDQAAQIPVKQRGLEATTRQQELTTSLAETLNPGQKALGLGQQDIALEQQGIDKVLMTMAKAPFGPDYIARVGEAIQSSKVDKNHPIFQYLRTAKTPQEAKKKALEILQHQSTMSPTYRQAMDLGQQTGEYSLSRQRLANQGAMAQARAAHKPDKSPQQIFMESKGIEDSVIQAAKLYELPGIDAQTKEFVKRFIESNMEAYSTIVQRGVIPPLQGIPVIKQLRSPTQPNAPQAQPGRGALPQGVRLIE